MMAHAKAAWRDNQPLTILDSPHTAAASGDMLPAARACRAFDSESKQNTQAEPADQDCPWFHYQLSSSSNQ